MTPIDLQANERSEIWSIKQNSSQQTQLIATIKQETIEKWQSRCNGEMHAINSWYKKVNEEQETWTNKLLFNTDVKRAWVLPKVSVQDEEMLLPILHIWRRKNRRRYGAHFLQMHPMERIENRISDPTGSTHNHKFYGKNYIDEHVLRTKKLDLDKSNEQEATNS